MAKTPTAYIDSEGIAWVRCQVPRLLWDVVIRVGKNYAEVTSNRKIADARAAVIGMGLLHKHIVDLFEAEETSWLPDSTFGKELFKLRDDNYGALPSDTDGKIDISLLHRPAEGPGTKRGAKPKSGFVGVYPNGSGWRAESKNKAGKAVHIGSYKTAEEAAYKRRLFHIANGLAYGELEVEMERWRDPKSGYNAGDYTEKQLIEEIKDHSRNMTGGWDLLFGPGCCSIEPVFDDDPDDLIGLPRPDGSKLPTRAQALGRAPLPDGRTLPRASPIPPKPATPSPPSPSAPTAAGSVMADPYNPEQPLIPKVNKHGFIDMTKRPRAVVSAIAPGETPVAFNGVIALGFEDGNLPPGVLDE